MAPREAPDAAFGHRRTSCVWCGRRIPGALTDADDRPSRRDLDYTAAARQACPVHRSLVIALDAYYNGEQHG